MHIGLDLWMKLFYAIMKIVCF